MARYSQHQLSEWLGLLEDINSKMTLDFKEEGDLIFLMGTSNNDINSSQYLNKICGVEFSPAPHFELEEEFLLQQKITELIKSGIIKSAHDVSEGGLFVTLLESGFHRNLGFDVVAADYTIRKDAQWFGEKQSRVVVTLKAERVLDFKKMAGNHPFEELGLVTNGSVEVDGMEWGFINEWKNKYDTAIENYLLKEEAGSALGPL